VTFRASEVDRRKSLTLLKLRTPSNSAYQRYRTRATRWLSAGWLDTPSIVIHGKTVKVERFAFHTRISL
jgi:hypothetical protein